jgi:hypothetical protein
MNPNNIETAIKKAHAVTENAWNQKSQELRKQGIEKLKRLPPVTPDTLVSQMSVLDSSYNYDGNVIPRAKSFIGIDDDPVKAFMAPKGLTAKLLNATDSEDNLRILYKGQPRLPEVRELVSLWRDTYIETLRVLEPSLGFVELANTIQRMRKIDRYHGRDPLL